MIAYQNQWTSVKTEKLIYGAKQLSLNFMSTYKVHVKCHCFPCIILFVLVNVFQIGTLILKDSMPFSIVLYISLWIYIVSEIRIIVWRKMKSRTLIARFCIHVFVHQFYLDSNSCNVRVRISFCSNVNDIFFYWAILLGYQYLDE